MTCSSTSLHTRWPLLVALLLTVTTLTACDTVDGLLGNDDDTQTERVELFPVLLNGDWGYINEYGRIVIEPTYDRAGPFHEGLARVFTWGRRTWSYIDASGEEVIAPRFEDARNFSDGLAAVKMDGRWGFVDRQGRWVINPQYISPGTFSEGRAFVRLPNRDWVYIDRNGELVRGVDTPEMEQVDEPNFVDGRALFQNDDDDTYGFIDKSGVPVIPSQYPSARAFGEGLAAVKVSDRWGFIDPDQRTVINPRFIEAGSFRDGRAPVRENSNSWGYIDRDGTMRIESQFDNARPFAEGRAAVQQFGLWGFIDRDGSMVTEAEFDEVSDFRGGLARVTLETLNDENETITRIGYVDRDGAFVWYPTR